MADSATECPARRTENTREHNSKISAAKRGKKLSPEIRARRDAARAARAAGTVVPPGSTPTHVVLTNGVALPIAEYEARFAALKARLDGCRTGEGFC